MSRALTAATTSRRLSSRLAKGVEVAVVPSTSYHYYRTKKNAVLSPRFEQTDLSRQPKPMPAMDLIAQEPVRMLDGRIATCNGGGGPTGHPRVYINIDQPGAHACGYCGAFIAVQLLQTCADNAVQAFALSRATTTAIAATTTTIATNNAGQSNRLSSAIAEVPSLV